MKTFLISIAIFLAVTAALVVADTWVLPARPRPGVWSPDRYANAFEGLIYWDHTTEDVNDVTLSLDPLLTGYLERVVAAHDGNAPAWAISVTDSSGAVLAARTIDADADPCSVVCCPPVPFAGGLTVAIADANQNRPWVTGDGNDVRIRLYLREVWRR